MTLGEVSDGEVVVLAVDGGNVVDETAERRKYNKQQTEDDFLWK